MDMHSGLVPRQFRGVDAAPEKPGRMLQVEKRLPDAAFQFVHGRWRSVGERLLGLGPDVLVRIELRCVGGKVVQVKAPAAMQILAHGFVPMDFGSVPQEHDLAPEVPQQQAERLDDSLPVDVVPMAPEIPADPLVGRGYRDRGDDRDPVVPVAMAKDRRLSDRSPGLSDVRGEHETAFIEEDQMSPELTGVFLYRASWPVSIWQSPPSCARSPGAPVFARSIPIVEAATAGRRSGRNARRTASRSDPRPGAASKGPWRIPLSGRRRPAGLSAGQFEPASAGPAAPGSVWCANLDFRFADRLGATAPLNSPTTSQPKPPSDRSRPSAATRSPSAGAVPAVVDCQEVSCPHAYQNGKRLSIL